MSLKNKFKTNPSLVSEGVWFDLATNSDKTKARIRLRRHGRSNRDWVLAFRKHTADKDMDAVTPEEDEQITAAVFVEACVVDWEHMQPEDDGHDIPFSKEAALELFSNPEWNDLLKECQTLASGREAYQTKKAEAEAGN